MPIADRIVPTLAIEGDHVLIAERSFLDCQPVRDSHGHPVEGTVFVDDRGYRMYQGHRRAYKCDENGWPVNARSILRPPSYSPVAWSDLEDPTLRKRAWERFWKGEDPPLPANTSSAAAARLEHVRIACIAYEESARRPPQIGEFIPIPQSALDDIRAALDAIPWRRSRRTYVPGDGFCVGASCMPKGALYQKPRGEAEENATRVINAAIRQCCHPSLTWTTVLPLGSLTPRSDSAATRR